jgi:RNA polymerase sigma-70 factor (ECF subfamily)
VQHSQKRSALAEHQASGQQPEGCDDEFRTELLSTISYLRAYSHSLCRHRELADDLAQDTLCKAWEARSHFRSGSNLRAWLFTILRNEFYSHCRNARRQQAWDEGISLGPAATEDEQDWAAQLSDAARALETLSSVQREALILVGVGGFAYDDAAAICKCRPGTTKSRVARARKVMMGALQDSRALRLVPRPPIGRAADNIMVKLDKAVWQEGA